MSLDTVLQIGKALRSSKEGMKHFKYIKACPGDTEKETVLRLNIPVKEDFSFDWNNVSAVPENQARNLYYLTFKTSDADGLVKYLFGDIYYEIKSSVNRQNDIETIESGFYRLADDSAHGLYKKSSFERCEDDFLSLKEKSGQGDEWLLNKFRNTFAKDKAIIDNILRNFPAISRILFNNGNVKLLSFLNDETLMTKYLINEIAQTNKKNFEKIFGRNFNLNDLNADDINRIKKLRNGKVFLHFDFDGKHWYDFKSDLDLITGKMLDDFFEQSKQGYVLKKALYKTLCSGDKKNDIQFPGFKFSSKHKSKYFSEEDAKNLFYAKEYSEKALFTLRGNEIKIIVLPRGKNLNASDYEEFLKKGNEDRIANRDEQGHNNEEEPLFVPLAKNENPSIMSFDFIFSKKGGLTSPDSDLIELSGIEKSVLKATMQRINKIGSQIKEKYGYNQQPKIEWCLLNILGSSQSDQKTGKVIFKPTPKYQSHILKILPQIYSQTYYQDGILLPSFIDKVEFSVRSGDPKYNTLKYYLEFLLSIQNTANNRYMEIVNSKNYQAGLLLGSLSKGLKNKINPFEKNYVGNLSRRISTLYDCIKFRNEIEQKNIMHDLAKYTIGVSNELSTVLKELKEETYDKEEVALGFFESYFRYEAKKGLVEKLEKLLTDFASNEDEETIALVHQISQILETNRNK